MDENKKVVISVVAFFALVALVLTLYFLVLKKKPEEPVETPEIQQEMPVEEQPAEEPMMTPEPLDVDLDNSDELVRTKGAELSSHAALLRWLKSEDLIRKFVAAVDNIAQGESPRPHINFFQPDGEFEVVVRDGRVVIDPASYSRYNLVADVFSSLNTRRTVAMYWLFSPALQKAYEELGYPEGNFQKTLVKAVSELLKVPVLDQDVEVEKDVVAYRYLDPRLEGLSLAQKHLLRMGPENVEIIQSKLRDLARELGVSESELPRKI